MIHARQAKVKVVCSLGGLVVVVSRSFPHELDSSPRVQKALSWPLLGSYCKNRNSSPVTFCERRYSTASGGRHGLSDEAARPDSVNP